MSIVKALWAVAKFVLFSMGVLLSVALLGKNSAAVRDVMNDSVPLVKF